MGVIGDNDMRFRRKCISNILISLLLGVSATVYSNTRSKDVDLNLESGIVNNDDISSKYLDYFTIEIKRQRK